jgi:hypothetical protein
LFFDADTDSVNAIKRSDAGTMFDESSFMYAHTGSFPPLFFFCSA